MRSYRGQKSEQWEDRDTREMSNRWRLATLGAPRFLVEAPQVPFNLVGGVLNVVRRATFDVFDQARNIALQYDKIPPEIVRYRDPSPSMRS